MDEIRIHGLKLTVKTNAGKYCSTVSDYDFELTVMLV